MEAGTETSIAPCQMNRTSRYSSTVKGWAVDRKRSIRPNGSFGQNVAPHALYPPSGAFYRCVASNTRTPAVYFFGGRGRGNGLCRSQVTEWRLRLRPQMVCRKTLRCQL